MSTRSITIFEDERGEEIACLYRHHDGYPEGHGVELLKAIGSSASVGNGIGLNAGPSYYNGMSDLAVRVITKLKNLNGGPKDPGGFYLYPAGTTNVGEEYRYRVTLGDDGVPVVRVSGYGDPFTDLKKVLDK